MTDEMQKARDAIIDRIIESALLGDEAGVSEVCEELEDMARAEAWDEGWDAGWTDCEESAAGRIGAPAINPYRVPMVDDAKAGDGA